MIKKKVGQRGPGVRVILQNKKIRLIIYKYAAEIAQSNFIHFHTSI